MLLGFRVLSLLGCHPKFLPRNTIPTDLPPGRRLTGEREKKKKFISILSLVSYSHKTELGSLACFLATKKSLLQNAANQTLHIRWITLAPFPPSLQSPDIPEFLLQEDERQRDSAIKAVCECRTHKFDINSIALSSVQVNNAICHSNLEHDHYMSHNPWVFEPMDCLHKWWAV